MTDLRPPTPDDIKPGAYVTNAGRLYEVVTVGTGGYLPNHGVAQIRDVNHPEPGKQYAVFPVPFAQIVSMYRFVRGPAPEPDHRAAALANLEARYGPKLKRVTDKRVVGPFINALEKRTPEPDDVVVRINGKLHLITVEGDLVHLGDDGQSASAA